MIWLLLFAPVLIFLYVAYLIVKALLIIVTLPYFAYQARKPQIGELDPVTDRVKWI